jgi:hypothetical protein
MLVCALVFRAISDNSGSDTIHPFVSGGIHGTIELLHSDSLGVQDVIMSDFIFSLMLESGLSVSQHLIVHSLATTAWADKH